MEKFTQAYGVLNVKVLLVLKLNSNTMSGKMIKQWIISAKVEGFCKETNKRINIGDEILYISGVKNLSAASVYHKDSYAYKNAIKNDIAITGFKI